MRKMMNKKGFTLVELMIVVVILGILVAIAVPIYSAVTRNAKIKACNSNMRIIRSNLASYILGAGTSDGATHEFTEAQVTAGDQTSALYGSDDFKAMFDKNAVPQCTGGSTPTNYTITATSATSFTVACASTTGCPNAGCQG